MLILTEKYAALDILKNTKNYLASSTLQGQITSEDKLFILFGNRFPKDKEYTQVCTL